MALTTVPYNAMKSAQEVWRLALQILEIVSGHLDIFVEILFPGLHGLHIYFRQLERLDDDIELSSLHVDLVPLSISLVASKAPSRILYFDNQGPSSEGVKNMSIPAFCNRTNAERNLKWKR